MFLLPFLDHNFHIEIQNHNTTAKRGPNLNLDEHKIYMLHKSQEFQFKITL